jgi:hypothetical protein
MNPPILNMSKLAKSLGVSLFYVLCMKKSGFIPSHGKKSTLKAAVDWLEEHQDFVTTGIYPRKRRETRPNISVVPLDVSADKCGEPMLTHG